MSTRIGRRDVIAMASAAAACPLAARAQQKRPVVGILNANTIDANRDMVAIFRLGMADQGFTEGRNVELLHLNADGRYDRLASLAADLVGRKVDVIFATGGNAAVHTAKAATATIPIVFTMGSDPIRDGLVKSLNEPGGNITGATFFARPVVGKRLALLRELVPNIASLAALINPTNPAAAGDVDDIVEASKTLGLRPDILRASTAAEIERAFTTLGRPDSALFVNADSFLHSQRPLIAALAAKKSVPAIYPRQEYVKAGGLISYATDVSVAYRIAGSYVGRILKGEAPGRLPVQLPTKFELTINTRAAKALGLSVPPLLLALADEVIE